VEGHDVDFERFDVGNSSAGVPLNIVGNYSRVIGNRARDQKVGCSGNGAAGIEAQGWRDGGYRGHHQLIIGNLVEDIGTGPLNAGQLDVDARAGLRSRPAASARPAGGTALVRGASCLSSARSGRPCRCARRR
jgi:hypothetical protein